MKAGAGVAGICLALGACGGGSLRGPTPPAGAAGHPSGSGASSGSGGPSSGGGLTSGGGSSFGDGSSSGGGLTSGAGLSSGSGGPSPGGAGAVGTAGAGGTNSTAGITPDPWPSSCLSVLGPQVPLTREQLLGAGRVEFGLPALPGEAITAKLNGVPISFSASFYELLNDDQNALIFGYGDHGELGLSAFPLAVGTYACPSAAALTYDAPAIDPLTGAVCCRIEVTKVGEVGDTIEGTFSGIAIQSGGGSWINVEEGRFTVVRRAPELDAGNPTD